MGCCRWATWHQRCREWENPEEIEWDTWRAQGKRVAKGTVLPPDSVLRTWRTHKIMKSVRGWLVRYLFLKYQERILTAQCRLWVSAVQSHIITTGKRRNTPRGTDDKMNLWMYGRHFEVTENISHALSRLWGQESSKQSFFEASVLLKLSSSQRLTP